MRDCMVGNLSGRAARRSGQLTYGNAHLRNFAFELRASVIECYGDALKIAGGFPHHRVGWMLRIPDLAPSAAVDCRRISYKHRPTIRSLSARPLVRGWPAPHLAGSRKSGATMDATAASQGNFDADKVRALIAEYLDIDVKQVRDETHFSDDLGLDWLDQLELMILIEDEFAGIELSDNAALEVVGDLIRHIEMTKKVLTPPGRRSAA
jgi:acyl carrier protein